MTRWGGLAGIAFGVSVVAQNVWLGASGIDPAIDAGAAEIASKFAEHATAHGVLAAWVAVNLVLMAAFLAAAHTRLRSTEPALSVLGTIGGVLLMALFAMVSVPRVALALGAADMGDEPALVDALWHLHTAVFAYAGVALGIALLGFSLAAVNADLVPRWFRVVGPVGAAAIVAFSVPVQVGASGSPLTMAGGVGFLSWLLFMVVFGLRLWRESDAT